VTEAADHLAGRLAAGQTVIIDGGTGTALQTAGVPMDDEAWSGRANLDSLDLVQAVHESYVTAGADVLIANTFAASRAALEPAGLGSQVARANENAILAARRAAAAAGAGRSVAVAGSLSSFCPVAMHGRGELGVDYDDAVTDPRFPSLADYREQAKVIAAAGADLIALELMDATGYGQNAVTAAAETGLPVWLGVSPVRLDDGTVGADPTMGTGESLDDLVRALAVAPVSVVNVMHAKPDVVLETIATIRRHWDGPVGVYAETGEWGVPDWVFNGLNPDEYLAEAENWVANGATLVGGCCGVGTAHIARLASRFGQPSPG
jgi:S-methylmethionine-dependent homocysteine/selenocysteine methylase